eukprot:TRINITY_DN6573_c0_g1_i5.p1 TRINITY_DN6573_c0_g1~~TRINITY_DN6573_c0_g1_i5.p1  ORF type:complete len:362 (+),score=89.15 TRINITY_DN6573_c0_g1_i5:134-1219(+)
MSEEENEARRRHRAENFLRQKSTGDRTQGVKVGRKRNDGKSNAHVICGPKNVEENVRAGRKSELNHVKDPQSNLLRQVKDAPKQRVVERIEQQGKPEASLELKKLKAEVGSLRAELRSMVEATRTANPDARRLMMLQSQNAQLQRQVDLYASNTDRMAECVTRARAALERVGAASGLDDQSRQLIRSAQESIRAAPHIPGPDELQVQLRFDVDDFGSLHETVPRVFSGDVSHVDFKSVQRLEQMLATLHPSLVGLRASLLGPLTPQCGEQLSTAVDKLAECTRQLSTLAFITPTQPSRLNRSSATALRGSSEPGPCCWAHGSEEDWVGRLFENAARSLKQGDPAPPVLKRLAGAVRAALQV